MLLTIIFSSIYISVEDPINEFVEELLVRKVISINYPTIKNYWIDTLQQSVLITDAMYDTIKTLKGGAFLFYEKQPIRMIIEPVAKFGKNNIWPNQGWETWENLAAEYGTAFIMLYNKNFSFILGREKFATGVSPRNNLLISGKCPPLDGMFFSYEQEKFKISYLFSRLNDIKDENLKFKSDTIHTDTIQARRFFVLRRLDFKPKNWLNIGLNETAIFGGEELPDFYYLNPIVSVIPLEEVRPTANHNVLWDIDAKINLKNIAAYVEFLIDDFQYLPDAQNEPNHTGFLLGTELAKSKNFFQIEYTRISSWTYNHFFTWQKYEYLGYPIGHPLGCDFDEIFTKMTHHFNKRFDIFIKLSHIRKGENNLNTLWPIPECPREEGKNFPSDNFLRGKIKNYIDFGIGVNVYFKLLYSFIEVGICDKKPSIRCSFRFNKI